MERQGRAGSFWRCSNCGGRFLGPTAPAGGGEGTKRRSRRGADGLARTIEAARRAKRFFFPILAVLATILTVIYLLDRQSAPLERISLP